MSSKDKESKTFEKLKQFFRSNKGGAGNLKGRIDFSLSPDIEKDLGPESPLNHRLKNIKELSEAVLNNRLEDNSVERLWQCLRDLLHHDVAKEARQQVFAFFRCLVQGQYEKLGLMRVHFFRIVRSDDLPDDVGPRLDLLVSLTDNGKDILYLEEEVPPWMLQWMPAVVHAGKSCEFLSMLVNVIKYNAALIDEYVIKGLVDDTCWLSCHSDKKVVLVCLDVLDTVVCYTSLPTESLPVFIAALCRTVSYEPCVATSWKVMRNLLGTHMGHSTLYTMCRMLQQPDCLEDVRLIRGAVFYVNMGLWGAHRVTTLKYTPTSVLPSLLHALECNERLVVYEVILSMQRLISKHGLELHDPAWDLVLVILETVNSYIENSEAPQPVISAHLHDTLTSVEQLVESDRFNGSADRVYQLTEHCSRHRPEASVLRLIVYLAAEIEPTRPMWLARLNTLLDRYLKQDTRTNVRVKAMEVLANVVRANRAIFEDELMERVVVPHLTHSETDTDPVVRTAAVHLLVELCIDCDTKRCLELLEILHKIVARPFEAESPLHSYVTESDVMDVKAGVAGLVKIFTAKMSCLPSSHCVRAYKLLVNHLETHYQRPAVLEYVSCIRYSIFECLLQLRANSLSHLGIQTAGGVVFSPYLGVDHKEGGGGTVTPPPMSPAPAAHPPCMVTHLSMSHACKVVITCLKQEKDWKVLQLILKEVPTVMRNKALILSRGGASGDVDLLAAALCCMVSDKALCLPDTLRNTPLKFTRSDFHAFVFPVLASLASYHAYLEPSLQQRLIKCLEVGLNSRQCACQCVTALTTCILEMREAMYKLLPEVLLNLSKISATTYIAVPILEFLSTLTRLPKVFASFVGDQYMSVFAISLPYTNPFKYDHYTVSLAHHVIAVWFLKCRLPFRRDFVKFITTGLKANVLVPFEEGQLMKSEVVNEDSSNRKRASSLTEQGSRRQVRPLTAGRLDSRVADLKPPIDEALMTFHVELTETCIDLMARYTFNTCGALPKRHPTAEFLLAGGQSMTWLLGNKLVTVTTSGCSQKPLKNGLCDKCWMLCKADRVDLSPDSKSGGGVTRAASVDVPSKEPKEGGVAAADVPSRLTKQLSIDINPRPTPLPQGPSSVGGSPVDGGRPPVEQPEPSRLDQLLFGSKPPEKEERGLCACWCQGWAEIYVRRPTGDMSWVMRVQNPASLQSSSPLLFPLEDVSTLFLPSLNPSARPAERPCDPVADDEAERATRAEPSLPIAIPGTATPPSEEETEDDMEDVEGVKSRNPVRRSNSSPEMSAAWKNPFLKEKKEGKLETAGGAGEEGDGKKTGKQVYKDPRVSCEAIPEEMAGTTPPAAAPATPAFLSVHSYPGAEADVKAVVEPSRTVPPSPTALLSPVSALRSAAVAPSAQAAVVSSRPPQSPKLQQKTSAPLAPLTVDTSGGAAKKLTLDKPTAQASREEVRPDPSALSPLAFKRDRGHTISVMSPVRKPRGVDWNQARRDNSPRAKEGPRSGISPSYVFLQLYHNAHFSTEKPLLLSQGDVVQRSIKILDHIPPYETHKVGVLYVGPGQASNEAEILRNQFGSLRYAEFLQRLGTLIKLQDADAQTTFLGGLHKDGNDGKFAYIWQDDVMQVTFHVATLMPTKESDSLCNGKKLHIGNDYVNIVYNESGEEYNIQTVKGQFNYACVIIQPLDHSTNQVTVKTREELSGHIGHAEPKIVSDQNLAILTRQLALHANLASMISSSLKTHGQDPYASNWLERLRKIKRLRAKVLQESNSAGQGEGSAADDPMTSPRSARRVHMDDFTEYT